RAAKEQAYLLRVTVAAAAGFGLLVVALPPADGTWLLGAFVAAQAAWAALLLLKVVRGWPGRAAAGKGRDDAGGVGADGRRVLARRSLEPKNSHRGATADEPFPAKHRHAAPGPARPGAGPPGRNGRALAQQPARGKSGAVGSVRAGRAVADPPRQVR